MTVVAIERGVPSAHAGQRSGFLVHSFDGCHRLLDCEHTGASLITGNGSGAGRLVEEVWRQRRKAAACGPVGHAPLTGLF